MARSPSTAWTPMQGGRAFAIAGCARACCSATLGSGAFPTTSSACRGSHVTILARTGAMAEPFRRMREVDEVRVTGKGVKGILRNVLWARRAHADVYLVPFPSNRWQYSLLALFSGAKRKLLHGYPVGKIRALGFIGERVPAVRGLHDVVQNLRLLKHLGASPDESD